MRPFTSFDRTECKAAALVLIDAVLIWDQEECKGFAIFATELEMHVHALSIEWLVMAKLTLEPL